MPNEPQPLDAIEVKFFSDLAQALADLLSRRYSMSVNVDWKYKIGDPDLLFCLRAWPPETEGDYLACALANRAYSPSMAELVANQVFGYFDNCLYEWIEKQNVADSRADMLVRDLVIPE